MKLRRWTEDDIILAIWEWDEKHGKPPTYKDWRRASPGEHPTALTVYTHFGSLNEAIRQAGLTPNEPTPRVEIDEKLAKRLRREGLTERAIAKRLGVSTDVLRKRIGPRPRPIASKKRTREQRIADLQKALREEVELAPVARRRSSATR